MKRNYNKYMEVDTLPTNALTVREYADSKGVTTNYIYKLIKEGKNDFGIVIFRTINFIIPN